MIKYMGGKFSNAKEIAAILEAHREEGQVYFEPFVGGAWVVARMSGKRIANDLNKALITYYKAIQEGYVPPENLSEEEFKQIKLNNDHNDPITAFALIGCSFGGIWGNAYARDKKGRNYAREAHNNALKHREKIKDVYFHNRDYLHYEPKGCLIYCDPPYKGTTGYKAVGGKFDHDKFWDTMREWSKDNTAIISEHNAPDDFEIIWEKQKNRSIRSNSTTHMTERLYKWKQ